MECIVPIVDVTCSLQNLIVSNFSQECSTGGRGGRGAGGRGGGQAGGGRAGAGGGWRAGRGPRPGPAPGGAGRGEASACILVAVES